MSEQKGENGFCYSSNDPMPRIDALLTTFVEGIGYLKEHPNRKDACIYLMEEVFSKMRKKASQTDDLLIEHMTHMTDALNALKQDLSEKNFANLREAALKVQNDLLRL